MVFLASTWLSFLFSVVVCCVPLMSTRKLSAQDLVPSSCTIRGGGNFRRWGLVRGPQVTGGTPLKGYWGLASTPLSSPSCHVANSSVSPVLSSPALETMMGPSGHVVGNTSEDRQISAQQVLTSVRSDGKLTSGNLNSSLQKAMYA